MRLTLDDYKVAAKQLNCEVAAIMAVAHVEAPKGGFNTDGSLTALFEPHIFWKELKKLGYKPETLLKGNEDILSPVWNKKLYPANQKGVYEQIKKAADLCRKIGFKQSFNLQIEESKPWQLSQNVAFDSSYEVVYRAVSWGKFQVLGNNYKDLGFKSALHLKTYLHKGEGSQLQVFSKFVIVNHIDDELQELDFEGFALVYNGRAYRENNYHIKMKSAYETFKKSLLK